MAGGHGRPFRHRPQAAPPSWQTTSPPAEHAADFRRGMSAELSDRDERGVAGHFTLLPKQ